MNISNGSFSELSCQVRQLMGRPKVDNETETILRYITIGFLVLLFPFAVFLNSLSIYLILKFKHLHQTTFFLALQVVIIDLAVTLLTMPLTVTNGNAGKWILGLAFCKISATAFILLRQMRNWTMFVFVCDRFCTVFYPLRYFKFRKKVVLPLYTAALLISVILTSVSLSFDCMGFSRVTWYCSNTGGCTNPSACEIARATIVPVSNVFGSYIPLVMYIILFIKARKIRNRIAPGDISNETLETRKREKRANVTFLLLFLSLFGVSFVPVIFFIVVRSTLQALGVRPPPGYVITTVIFRTLYNILPIVDPVAIMRNADVRKALKILKAKMKIHRFERKTTTTGGAAT